MDIMKYLNQDFPEFKKVNIYFHDHNLGPYENTKFLKELLKMNYDTYIFSEDDNEFSPNFLEYINKGLEKFENDENVIAICGFKDTNWETDGHNIVASKLFPSYGFGSWFVKEEQLISNINNTLISENNLRIKSVISLYKKNSCLFSNYISGIVMKNDGLFWDIDGNIKICDTTRSIYMHLSNKICIVPSDPKSRTWGNDGSGVNMPKQSLNPKEKWILDESVFFDYEQNNKINFLLCNYKKGNDYLKPLISKKSIISAIIKYLVLCCCSFDRTQAIRITNKLWRILKHE